MDSPEESVHPCTIDDLPDEILEYILSLISPYKDAESVLRVSKRWAEAMISVSQRTKCELYRAVVSAKVVWSCIVPPNLGPTTTITKRYSHAACLCENFMFVFGGCTLRCTMFNDMWMLDLTTRKWIRPYSTGCYPSPKACATMCSYNKTLILFGGWTHPPPYPLHQIQRLFNELHIYEITSNTWSIVHSDSGPPPMAGHSATVHRNKMIVFGGLQWGGSLFLYSRYGSSNDVWSFNFDTLCWTKPYTTSPRPDTRYGQSQIYLDDENLLIMGGCQGPNSILDDMWTLNMAKEPWVWKQVRVINPQWAAPHLWCHPACRVGDVVVVFSSGIPQSMSHYTSCAGVRPSSPLLEDIPPEVLARQALRDLLPMDHDVDVNVNGQRGTFGKRFEEEEDEDEEIEELDEEPRASTSNAGENALHESPLRFYAFGERGGDLEPHDSGNDAGSGGELQLAAFRIENPSSSNSNNSRNRARQLETLKKLEERYKNPNKPGKDNDPNDPIPGPSGGIALNKMSMYVMDISEALAEVPTVTWRPPKMNRDAPRDTVFHSLILGKGELILFGGVQKNSSASTFPVSSYKSVSNNTHIITAARRVV